MYFLIKPCLICFILGSISNSHAIQPISDESLALASGENSIVISGDQVQEITAQIDEKLILEEMPAVPSFNLLTISYPVHFNRIWGKQNEDMANEIGSEYFRHIWQGNTQDIYNHDLMSVTYYNPAIGDYELKNVQGRISTSVEINEGGRVAVVVLPW